MASIGSGSPKGTSIPVRVARKIRTRGGLLSGSSRVKKSSRPSAEVAGAYSSAVVLTRASSASAVGSRSKPASFRLAIVRSADLGTGPPVKTPSTK